jgi:diguanylate cyclase (GGDEF)-like protein
MRIPGSVGYAVKAVSEKTPLLIHNCDNDPACKPGQMDYRGDTQSAVVAPLILRDQVLGSLSLESNTLNAFNNNDLRLLVSFAATATAAIQNARLHQEAQTMAITDDLTGLYNRRGLYELGQREVERARRFRRPLAAIMMDIDNFKQINDTYGHSTGDQVLQAVAQRCRENLRKIDILGRLGGDEFAILLPETDMFTASSVAERVRQYIAETPVETQQVNLDVTVSIGIARATDDINYLDKLIRRADSAMYTAKNGGRNRIDFL